MQLPSLTLGNIAMHASGHHPLPPPSHGMWSLKALQGHAGGGHRDDRSVANSERHASCRTLSTSLGSTELSGFIARSGSARPY